MKANEIKLKTNQYIADTYARFDLALDEGKGSTVFGEGREFLDFGAGIAVNGLGVSDNEWVKTVAWQAQKLNHTSNLYYSEPCARLAEMLCQKSGMEKVFFGNSGAEANECAVKVARKYSFDKYGYGRYEIITLQNSFHGRTIATLSATGQDCFHNIFNPFLEGFRYAQANEFSALKRMVNPKTCAVMLELVQGEGGVNALDKAFVRSVAKLCAENDLLLIIDEVQTGNGRTGTLYAYMQYGLKPDIVTTAKGLGGGLPIGACLLGEKVKDTLTLGSHGSTFGGNPICCAGAVAVLSRLTDTFLAEVNKKAEYLWDGLKKISGVNAVSGLGLMIGLSVNGNAKAIAKECLNHGLLVLTAKDKIRLLPALTVSYQEIDKALSILNEVLK